MGIWVSAVTLDSPTLEGASGPGSGHLVANLLWCPAFSHFFLLLRAPRLSSREEAGCCCCHIYLSPLMSAVLCHVKGHAAEHSPRPLIPPGSRRSACG